MKNLLLVLILICGQMAAAASQDIYVEIEMKTTMNEVTEAVQDYYEKQYKHEIESRNVVDHKLEMVASDGSRMEVSAIAPNPDEDDGIPYYCVVTYKKIGTKRNLTLDSVYCDKWD